MTLYYGDSLVEDVVGVKTIVVDNFKARFNESLFRRPILEDVPFNKLSSIQKSNLKASFSLADTKYVI